MIIFNEQYSLCLYYLVNNFFIDFLDEDKTYNITDNVVMGVTGEAGDVPRFAEYITQNVKLYRMRNGYDLSIPAIATFTRKTVAEHLRSQVIDFDFVPMSILWFFIYK